MRLAETLEHLNRLYGGVIRVIVLSFEQLKPILTQRIQNLSVELKQMRKDQTDATLRKLRRTFNSALRLKEDELKSVKDAYAQYRDTRAISTSLNISRAQQRLLFRAGAEVVKKNGKALIEGCGLNHE